MNKAWPFAFYLLIFGSVAFVGPFIVLFYQGLGFSGAQIGILTGVTPLISLVGAPLLTGIADATHRHNRVMSTALLAAITAMLIFPLMRLFLPILLLAAAYNLFFSPVSALADSATMAMLGPDRAMYGRIRLGGTIGFGLSAPLAGALVQGYGLRAAFWGCAVLVLLSLLVSQKFAYSRLSEGSFALSKVGTLLSDPRWVLFLVLAFAGGFGGASSHYYFFPYMMELGASETTAGLALTVATLSEVPVMFFGNRLLKRFTSPGMLVAAVGVMGLRMLLLAATGSPTTVLAINLLGGLTFPMLWIAGVSFADEHAPVGMRATAQGIFSAVVIGFGLSAGGFSGGLLLASIGGRGLNLVFGLIVSAIALAVGALLWRMRPPASASASYSPSTPPEE
jgi:MFS transporter, PPP family, 3-phenylpropionic acid transporter